MAPPRPDLGCSAVRRGRCWGSGHESTTGRRDGGESDDQGETPILLITPDMTGALRRLGGQSGRSKPVGTSFIWRLHPAHTRARAIRFPARRCGFPGPGCMCPGSVWTAHRVFASLRDAQVVCPVVGCGLRVEVDSVQCCVFRELLVVTSWRTLCGAMPRQCKAGTTPGQCRSVRILGVFAGHTA